MMARTHVVFGIFIGLLLMRFFSVKWYVFFPLLLFGALLPDVDTYDSKIGKKVGFLSKVLNFIFGHRGLFHGVWIALFFGVIVWLLFGKFYGVIFLIGYLSHLVIDGFTLGGVNFLYPLTDLRLNGFIRTGGYLEVMVFFVLLVFDIVKIIWLF